jgi:hypothetical protein
MNTTTRRQAIRQRIAVMTMVLVAVFGYFVFEMTSTAPAASAATSSTQALHCRYVTIPKTLPWYQCLQNIGGTSGSGNGPYGCYTHTKYVCD